MNSDGMDYCCGGPTVKFEEVPVKPKYEVSDKYGLRLGNLIWNGNKYVFAPTERRLDTTEMQLITAKMRLLNK